LPRSPEGYIWRRYSPGKQFFGGNGFNKFLGKKFPDNSCVPKIGKFPQWGFPEKKMWYLPGEQFFDSPEREFLGILGKPGVFQILEII